MTNEWETAVCFNENFILPINKSETKENPTRATIPLACQCRGDRSWPKLTWELGRFWNTAGHRRPNFVVRGADCKGDGLERWTQWPGMDFATLGSFHQGTWWWENIPWYSFETQQDRSTAQWGSPPRSAFLVQMLGLSGSGVPCLRTMWGKSLSPPPWWFLLVQTLFQL